MTLEINKELVMSTAHVKLDTMRMLNSRSAYSYAIVSQGSVDYRHWQIQNLVVYNYEFGIRIYINLNEPELKTPDILLNPVPHELAYCIKLARDNHCMWLVLDQDGDMVSDLESWEW